jgi:uncharacterized membrane protein YfcA
MFSLYLLIGMVAGTMAGLLGIGGGIIVVPALAGVFLYFKIMPTAYIMHMAIGTSLAAMILTLISALRSHGKRGNVRWDLVKLLLPGLMIGSIIGAYVAHELPSAYLKNFFSVFLCVIAVKLLFGKTDEEEGDLPSRAFMVASAGGIGVLSSILGAGGGTMLIPFMLRCKVNIRQAAGTSVACGVCIGIVATASFMLLGSTSVAIKWSTGYIYWPAFLGVAFTSMLFAPMGTALAQKLPTSVLKRVFGLFLAAIAVELLLSP